MTQTPEGAAKSQETNAIRNSRLRDARTRRDDRIKNFTQSRKTHNAEKRKAFSDELKASEADEFESERTAAWDEYAAEKALIDADLAVDREAEKQAAKDQRRADKAERKAAAANVKLAKKEFFAAKLKAAKEEAEREFSEDRG